MAVNQTPPNNLIVHGPLRLSHLTTISLSSQEIILCLLAGQFVLKRGKNSLYLLYRMVLTVDGAFFLEWVVFVFLLTTRNPCIGEIIGE